MPNTGFHVYRHHDGLPQAARGAVVAIGNFDGVHLGHQAVIGAAREIAVASGTRHAVLSFEPHPRSVFRPDEPPFRLTPFRAKARHIEAIGVDFLVSLHFDHGFAAIGAEDFIETILVQGLGVRHVVVGYDFVFGHRRRGTAALLAEAGRAHGFGVTVVAPAQLSNGDGEEVFSSTRVRDHLSRGEVVAAAALLGRPWEIEGRVDKGDQRGRTIGFPTANIALGDHLRPLAGVYAVRITDEATGERHDGVANIGTRPTVGGTDLRLEVNLFDFSGDLYGRHLAVALVDFIRPEQKFAGLDALKAQIAQDAARARAILEATRQGES